jgi:predicted TIM-barrel fold metal-dependent hydrolase
MTIDGYCHCGISKYRPVDVVLGVMNKHAVDRAVLCQHLGEYDNSYLAEVVNDHPGRFAAVCLVDPTQPDAHVQLRRWEEHGNFRGVRILAEWLEPYFPLWRAAVERAWCFMPPTVWLALFRRFADCCRTAPKVTL